MTRGENIVVNFAPVFDSHHAVKINSTDITTDNNKTKKKIQTSSVRMPCDSE
jgi:hypothetical protein